jgi:hypothetical protein
MARPSLGKLVGIGGCLVIGLAGGLAVRAVANVEPPSSGPPERAPSDGQLRAASVSGDVKVLARTGVWRPARKDDVVRRPTGFEVDVGASNINLVGPDVSITALNGARGLINGLGQPLRVYLRDGLAVVQSPKEQVTVIVESDDSEITGRSFGVRVDDGRVLVSAIGREVEVRRKGQIHRFPEGSEAILSSLGFRQVPLALELAVQIESAQRVGDRWQVRGRTSPTATALVAVGSRYARVPVEPDGRFTANIAEQQPRPGELIVQDSAGREAEVGRPSGAIDAGRAARRRATVGSAGSEPDALFPDDAPAAAPADADAAREPDPAEVPRASAAPAATGKPAGGGGGGGGKRAGGKRPGGKPDGEEGEGGDSITLGDFAEPADPSAEPEPKSVELPKTETPPKVEGAGRKAEKPAPKPAEDEGDEEVQLNW